MAFNARIPNNVATHVRKYTSTTQLVAKSKAGAIGMVSGVLYYKTLGGAAIAVSSSLLVDGTVSAPALAFASEPTLGFYRSAAGTVTLGGPNSNRGILAVYQLTASQVVSAASSVDSPILGISSGLSQMSAPAARNILMTDFSNAQGVRFKFDALPTVASGFGTSPSVTAGSTPMAGSINVGTGGVATTGVINFNGTAFPSAPFVVCMNTTTGAVVRATTSTTQLTITAPAAFTASDVVCWICVSSK